VRECLGDARVREPQALVDRVLAELIGDEGNEDDVCVLALRLVEERAPFRVTVPAEPAQVVRVRRELASWLARLDLDERRRADAVLAVSEAVANAVEHGYGFDPGGRVYVEARVEGGNVLMTVRDSGGWREPHASHERGRGRRIMETLMERVTVDAGGDGTVVRMALALGEAGT
jgi:anti-sigma regulatory factor (Ser/Thr protein kinase)